MAALVLAGSCGNAPSPSELSLTPVELGGEHGTLLETGLGPLLGYELQVGSRFQGYNLAVETWSKGELVKRQGLGGGGCDPTLEMRLGLIMVTPRRDGDNTELTFVLQQGGSLYHSDAVLADWDQLRNGDEGTSFVAMNKPTRLTVEPGKSIVLWRLNRSKAVPMQSLPSEVRKDVDDVLQVTITLRE